MSGLPAGFGVGAEVAEDVPKVIPRVTKKAPAERQTQGAPKPSRRVPLHHHTQPATGEGPSKRQKVTSSSSSLVSSNLGALAEPFVKDAELKAWAGRPEKEVQQAMAKASAELYYYTMTRLNSVSDLEARLKSSDEDKAKLEAELEVTLGDNDRLKKELDTHMVNSKREEKSLKDLLRAKDASLADALADVQELQTEVSSLKAEASKVKTDAYTEGFRGYLKGFLAVDPDYDWSEFGEATAKWMDEFKVLEADAIASKKAQITAENEKAKAATEARPQTEAKPAEPLSPAV